MSGGSWASSFMELRWSSMKGNRGELWWRVARRWKMAEVETDGVMRKDMALARSWDKNGDSYDWTDAASPLIGAPRDVGLEVMLRCTVWLTRYEDCS